MPTCYVVSGDMWRVDTSNVANRSKFGRPTLGPKKTKCDDRTVRLEGTGFWRSIDMDLGAGKYLGHWQKTRGAIESAIIIIPGTAIFSIALLCIHLGKKILI